MNWRGEDGSGTTPELIKSITAEVATSKYIIEMSWRLLAR